MWQLFAVDVWQTAPILVFPVHLEILAIVTIIGLFGIIWILPLFEVRRFKFNLVFLIVLSDSSLLFLQPILLNGSKFEVSVFKSALIWAESCVSRWKLRDELFGQVVELNVEMSHAIHVLPVFWVSWFLPHNLFLSSLHIDQGYSVTPPTLNLVGNLSWSAKNLALYSVIGAL